MESPFRVLLTALTATLLLACDSGIEGSGEPIELTRHLHTYAAQAQHRAEFVANEGQATLELTSSSAKVTGDINLNGVAIAGPDLRDGI